MKELFFDDDELVLDDPNIFIEEDGTYKLEPGDPGYVPPTDVPVPEPTKKRSKKMQYTYTETIGIINGVIAYLKKAENAALLAAKHYPVAEKIAEFTELLEELTELNADQEDLKVKLKNKTAELEGKLNSGWETTSGEIDSIAGNVGKNSAAGKNVKQIRSSVRRGGKEEKTPTPPAP